MLREHIFKKAEEDISRAVNDFKDLSHESKRERFIDVFQGLTKNVEKRINRVRSKLRRGTLNKLKAQIDSIILTHFKYESELLTGLSRKIG